MEQWEAVVLLTVPKCMKGENEMSKAYRELTGQEMPVVTTVEMREHCKRPGMVGDDGKPLYTTEQGHKKECDINHIIAKYDRTGLISHISKFEGQFGDVTGPDFKDAMDLVTRSQAMFNQLPVDIRNYFDNSPEKLLGFMDNPDNRSKAEELGLIDKRWTLETDGLGEHVKEGENVLKSDKADPE